jgi:hypothetical protein
VGGHNYSLSDILWNSFAPAGVKRAEPKKVPFQAMKSPAGGDANVRAILWATSSRPKPFPPPGALPAVHVSFDS